MGRAILVYGVIAAIATVAIGSELINHVVFPSKETTVTSAVRKLSSGSSGIDSPLAQIRPYRQAATWGALYYTFTNIVGMPSYVGIHAIDFVLRMKSMGRRLSRG